jgi:hypothetical protein
MSVTKEPIKKIPGLSPAEVLALDESSPIGDSSLKEAKQLTRGLSSEDLAKEAASREHHRTEAFKDHFENIAIVGLWVIAILFLAVGFTWFWHLLTPASWHYLNTDQVSKLQNIVTGGILTTIAANHVKKRVG